MDKNDRELFLQALGRAIEMMLQVDILAYRDGNWPERITSDRRGEFIKELAVLAAWLRTVRDLVEAYSQLERLAANESISEPSPSLM
jgi:hypothetical protein